MGLQALRITIRPNPICSFKLNLEINCKPAPSYGLNGVASAANAELMALMHAAIAAQAHATLPALAKILAMPLPALLVMLLPLALTPQASPLQRSSSQSFTHCLNPSDEAASLGCCWC